MLDPIRKTILYDQNAIYYGYPIEKLMERAGVGIADILVKKYGTGKRIGFFCGPGNNGGDGFAAARHLLGKAEAEVYLIPGADRINTPESQKNWRLYRGIKFDHVKARDIPNHFDVVVDCLFGTGVKGELRAPYPEIVERINKLKGKKVTIDLPTPGFKPKFNISMMFAKTKNAEVVDISYPKNLESKIGIGDVKILNQPVNKSHKSDNGKLLIIGGSRRYHGALLLATTIASKLVDLVYVTTVEENLELIKKLKRNSTDFITVEKNEIEEFIPKVDVVLVGPGLGKDQEAGKTMNKLIKKFPEKKFVIDADALKMLDPKLLNENIIVTPHCKEFETLFKKPGRKSNVKTLAKKYKCTIVLKGKIDLVCNAEECRENDNGNVGMTKGGTGDILAGLIAALVATNEPFLAASAGVFLNGLAGDRLHKRVGRYFSAADLVRELPRTLKWAEDWKGQE
jgi:NAD(P)H-hydrate epimerase